MPLGFLFAPDERSHLRPESVHDLELTREREADRRPARLQEQLLELAPDAFGRQIVERDARADRAGLLGHRELEAGGELQGPQHTQAVVARTCAGSTTRSTPRVEIGAPVEGILVRSGERIPGNGIDREVAPPRGLADRHRRIALDGEPRVPPSGFRLASRQRHVDAGHLVDGKAAPHGLHPAERCEQRGQIAFGHAVDLDVEVLRDAAAQPVAYPAADGQRPPAPRRRRFRDRAGKRQRRRSFQEWASAAGSRGVSPGAGLQRVILPHPGRLFVRMSPSALIIRISLVGAPFALNAWQAPAPASLQAGPETHLSNIKQLTFEGENAEAYFSFDGRRLVFQSTHRVGGCDQIYTMNVDGTALTRVSNGKGRTTCGFFYPDGQHILYGSTFKGSEACPPKPDFSRGYVWPVYDTYDIYRANADGSGIEPLTTTQGYDAEATIAKDGTIVFTSVRDGDMEIYSMRPDGSAVTRLTRRPGPDGGPFFSPDGSQIVFRGRELQPGKELHDYQLLLRESLWRPTSLEIFVMNRGRLERAPGHRARGRELRALLVSGRQADHLLVEPPQSPRP